MSVYYVFGYVLRFGEKVVNKIKNYCFLGVYMLNGRVFWVSFFGNRFWDRSCIYKMYWVEDLGIRVRRKWGK